VNQELARRHGAAIAAYLGPPGRLVAMSKTAYCSQHPGHRVVFNANVGFDAGKMWSGDLDLTVDESRGDRARRRDR
jgi:hypothetical protein